jgi:hypothetical protein
LLAGETAKLNSKSRRKLQRFKASLDAAPHDESARSTKNATVQKDASDANTIGPSSSHFDLSAANPSIENDPVQSADEFKKLLESSRTSKDVERSLNRFTMPDLTDSAVFEELKSLRDFLKNLNTRYDLTNASLRRRIGRMIYVMSTKEEQEELTALHKEKVANMPPPQPKQPKESKVRTGYNQVQAVDSWPENEVTSEQVSYIEQVKALQTAQDVESFATIFNVESVPSGDLAPLLQLIEALAEDGIRVNNAKLRRRVKRMASTIESAIASAPTEQECGVDNNTGADIEISTNVSEVAPSHDVFKAIKEAASAGDLEQALIQCANHVDAVDTDALSSLIATLEEIQGNETLLCNAKVRRRFSRFHDSVSKKLGVDNSEKGNAKRPLEETDDSSNDDQTQANELKRRKVTDDSSSQLASQDGGNDAGKPSSESQNIPQVAFLGQLSYNSTESSIEGYLRDKQIKGDIKVRLLTEANSNRSRGMAFVTVEAAAELHKVLALHHTKLDGRRINVERSCGGRNKNQRSEKITAYRKEQASRAQDEIDQVLMGYYREGILDKGNVEKKGQLDNRKGNQKIIRVLGESLLLKLYSYSVSDVTEVMDALREAREVNESVKSKPLAELHAIIAKKEGGDTYTDSLNKNYTVDLPPNTFEDETMLLE